MLAIAVALTGCETTKTQNTPTGSTAHNPDRAVKGYSTKAKAKPADTSGYSHGTGAYPIDADPGDCYAQVIVPAKYEMREERVLVKEASEKVTVVPAKYQDATERVMVKAPSTRLEVVPATYKTVKERIMVTPASERKVEVPAQYKWVEEKILVKPASTSWKPGTGFGNTTGSQNEILCFVEEPAQYETVRKQVLVSPATTRVETIPAQYKEITKTVVDTPATTKTVQIPAEYETVPVKKLVTPAKHTSKPVPAEYKTVQRRVMVTPSRNEWRQVLCETNATPQKIADIQAALKKAGYNVGSANGIMNSQTLAALQSYQKNESLPQGALDFETLKALGVELPRS